MCERCANHPDQIITAPPRRKKLWETHSQLHCSIVGTCLTLGDLRHIAAKLRIDIPAGFEDYDVHGHFAGAVGRAGPVAKAMHKTLEHKYAAPIRRFGRVTDEDALKALWSSCLEDGDIPGPYWALITHPAVTRRLTWHAFGHVHMLSHLVGAANRADIRQLRALELERDGLADELAKAKRRIAEDAAETRQLLERHADEVRSLGPLLSCAQMTEERLRVSEQRIRDLESGGIDRTQQRRIHELERQLSVEMEKGARTSVRAAALDRETEDLRRRNANLERAVRTTGRECQVLEAALCSDLAGSNPPRQSAMDLCGSRIVYVGGRTALVPHLRTFVLRSNGKFIHHDGGVEEKGDRLSDIVAQGDAVLCPVDCVSHGACRLAKRICKQRSKTFVALRGSSMAAFVSGLREIATRAGASATDRQQYPGFNNTKEREK